MTVTVAGVFPPDCETDSQGPPEPVEAVAVKPTGPPELGPVTWNEEGAGIDPETDAATAIDGTLEVSAGAEVTVKVTGIVKVPLALAELVP